MVVEPHRLDTRRSLVHLFFVWLLNGVGGGFLIAFFHNEREPRAYLQYALAGLVLMFFIIGVIAFANRVMRPRFFPHGVTLRTSAVVLYSLWFLALTAAATFAALWVLDHTFRLTRGIMSNPQAIGTTMMYVLLFATLNLISTYAITLYREVHVRVRTEAKAEQEMKLAAEVQRALLPAPSGQSRYVVAGLSIPSRAIGGDFFDHFELEGGRLGFVIADVAGKGAAAALLAAAAQGMIRMACVPDSPSATFQRVNAALPQHTGSSRFVTAFHGVLSPDGHLRFSNAGHLPGLLRRTSGEVQLLEANGLMLGPFPAAVFEENEVRLAPGDEVVVFSDGVSEATSTSGQYFGMERAAEVVAESPNLPAADLATRLVAAVQGFAKGRAPEDDLTVLVVRYEG